MQPFVVFLDLDPRLKEDAERLLFSHPEQDAAGGQAGRLKSLVQALYDVAGSASGSRLLVADFVLHAAGQDPCLDDLGEATPVRAVYQPLGSTCLAAIVAPCSHCLPDNLLTSVLRHALDLGTFLVGPIHAALLASIQNSGGGRPLVPPPSRDSGTSNAGPACGPDTCHDTLARVFGEGFNRLCDLTSRDNSASAFLSTFQPTGAVRFCPSAELESSLSDMLTGVESQPSPCTASDCEASSVLSLMAVFHSGCLVCSHMDVVQARLVHSALLFLGVLEPGAATLESAQEASLLPVFLQCGEKPMSLLYVSCYGTVLCALQSYGCHQHCCFDVSHEVLAEQPLASLRKHLRRAVSNGMQADLEHEMLHGGFEVLTSAPGWSRSVDPFSELESDNGLSLFGANLIDGLSQQLGKATATFGLAAADVSEHTPTETQRTNEPQQFQNKSFLLDGPYNVLCTCVFFKGSNGAILLPAASAVASMAMDHLQRDFFVAFAHIRTVLCGIGCAVSDLPSQDQVPCTQYEIKVAVPSGAQKEWYRVVGRKSARSLCSDATEESYVAYHHSIPQSASEIAFCMMTA